MDGFSLFSPFTIVSALILIYALFLIHRRIEIGLGHTFLVAASVVVFLMPFVAVKIGADGSFEVRRLDALGDATQKSIQGLAELDKRVKELASATEVRLAALEKASPEPKSDGTKPLTDFFAPTIHVPALDSPQDILRDLQHQGFTPPVYQGQGLRQPQF